MVDHVFLGLSKALYDLLNSHEDCYRGLVASLKLVSHQLKPDIVDRWVNLLRYWLVLVVQVLHHFARVEVLGRHVARSQLLAGVRKHILFFQDAHLAETSRDWRGLRHAQAFRVGHSLR